MNFAAFYKIPNFGVRGSLFVNSPFVFVFHVRERKSVRRTFLNEPRTRSSFVEKRSSNGFAFENKNCTNDERVRGSFKNVRRTKTRSRTNIARTTNAFDIRIIFCSRTKIRSRT